MSYIEKLKIINPDELNLEEVKSKYLEKWSKCRNLKYPYSAREAYKAIKSFLNCDDIIYFKNLEDITGIEDGNFIEDKKIGMYYSVNRVVPERAYTRKTICGEETEIEPAYVTTEYRFRKYTRSEMANKYFNFKNNNDELKKYMQELSNMDREKIKTNLVELAYNLFLSLANVPCYYYGYPIHGHIDWQWSNTYKDFPVGMRNVFAKIVNDNELNFSQSIILAILFPEFITNENYSELKQSEENNFVCCKTVIKTNERSKFPNGNRKLGNHTLIINQDLIDKIKCIFDGDYIFKLAPMETYGLKSKFDILFKEDWFKKYPSISKQHLLDLIFYAEDEKKLIKYLELIKDKSVEIQEKIINFISPISSYVSLKNEYTEDEIYNVINYINTLNFYKERYIKLDPEKYIKEYRKDYRKTYAKESSYNFDEYLYYNKRFSVEEMEVIRLHLKNEIATPVKIFDKEFNINVNTDIWSMHTHFVDVFETYFREKYTLLMKLLESENCEKHLDELLKFKDIIIKYAYINSTITLEQYHNQEKLRDLQEKDYEKAYEKVIAVRSIMDDEISLVLEQIKDEKKDHENNVFDECNGEKVFILTKNKKD